MKSELTAQHLPMEGAVHIQTDVPKLSCCVSYRSIMLRISEREIEEFSERFSKRYILKKKVNTLLCFFIALCGTTAVLYSRFVFHNSIFDRLRYKTFWGTIFTAVVSFIFGIVCIMEARKETEVTHRWVYFLRLSSATAEAVIFAVVMIGLLPIIPDDPDLSPYPGY